MDDPRPQTNRETTSEIGRWTAVETAELVRRGEIGPHEVVEDHLARIGSRNPVLGAVTRVDDTALDQADAVAARLVAGEELPLAGVPVTIKDNVDVAGQSSPNGLVALDGVIAERDAPTVAHLRDAGAIIVGRTNTPEFSWRWHTDNPLFGPTRNPWDPSITPGGSSGGAAAALAVGMGCLAQGNDAGGSVRWPAACCGVSALRPTQGRLPGHNATARGERPVGVDLMATQGPMARTVPEVAAMFEVLARPTWRDPAQLPLPAVGGPAGCETDGPSRFAVIERSTAASVVADAVERAATALESAGWERRPLPEHPSIDVAARLWARLINTDFAVVAGTAMRELGSEVVLEVLAAFDRAGPPLDVAELYEALAVRAGQLREWQRILTQELDVLLLPVADVPAWPVGRDRDGPDALDAVFRANRPLVAWNFLGLPAAAQPVDIIDGLPTSVQIVGRRFGDADVLAAAATLETVTGVVTLRDGSPL